MIITRKIIVGVCIVCAVGTSHSSMAQNRVVTQHTAGTVVEGEVTMLVTQETTTRYRRTTSQGVPEAELGYTRSNSGVFSYTFVGNSDDEISGLSDGLLERLYICAGIHV